MPVTIDELREWAKRFAPRIFTAALLSALDEAEHGYARGYQSGFSDCKKQLLEIIKEVRDEQVG